MNHEHLDILMNRAVDGKATAPEREELARALLADPTLRSEYDELMGAHISTVALFERLELPEDFTTRVMRRVQPDHVPTDADLTAIIEESDMPEPLPSPALASGKTATWHRQAKITTILSTVGALSAAAALLLAIGLLTGIIGSNKPQQPAQDESAKGQPGGPAERKGPAPTPAPKSEPGTPGEAKKEPGVPDSPKSEKAPENPQPKHGEEEEDRKLPPVEDNPPKDGETEKPKETGTPKEGTQPPKSEEPKPETGPKVEKQPEPTPLPPAKVDGDKGEEKKETTPNVPTPMPPAVWGRLMCVSSGNIKLYDENGKLIALDADTDVRMGMKFSTSASCVAVLTWQGGGYFSAGKSTVFSLAQNGFIFEDGEISVDYDGGKNPPYVSFGAYSLCVKSGTVLVEHKTSKKVAISQSSGESVLKFGEMTLLIEGGCQVDVDFGKMPATPKAKPFMLPNWCAEARREINLYRIDARLTERKATRTQTTNLQAQVTRLSKLPHTTACLVFLMNHVLELECLSVSDLTNMLKEVEKAYMAPDNKEMALDDTIKLAFECTCEIKSFAEWSKRFGNRVKEFSRKDMKEREAKKAEEEKRAREKEGKEQNGGSGKSDKLEKKEEPRDGKEAIPDKQKSEEEHKKD